MVKEYLSNIEPEIFDQEVYPQIMMGHLVGQHTLEGDALVYENPEKYSTPVELQEPLPEIHYAPTRNLPLQFYLHPVRPRGRK